MSLANKFVRSLDSRQIAFRIYSAVGSAALIAILLIVVTWQSFERISGSQDLVYSIALPEMVAVVSLSRASSDLFAAVPKLADAMSSDELNEVSAEITQLKDDLEAELARLLIYEETEDTEPISDGIANLSAKAALMEASMLNLFELRDRMTEFRADLVNIETQLRLGLIPLIDDQYFFLLTGRTQLDAPAAQRESHFTEFEVDLYRNLSVLEQQTNIALQLLSSSAMISDPALLDVRYDLFESARDSIQRSLKAINRPAITSNLKPMFDRLFSLGLDDGNGFGLRKAELRLLESQQRILTESQQISSVLVNDAERLVNVVNERATDTVERTAALISTSWSAMVTLGVLGVIGAMIYAWVSVGSSLMPRLRYLSQRMRRMGAGHLDQEVEVNGNDEIAEMAAALEIFRKSALDARRLNVVEKLSQDLQSKNDELQRVLDQLQSAQSQIVLKEKLAALGELTAGVAHEIKNPLNFVKNFSEASKELIEEMDEIINDPKMDDEEKKEEIISISELLMGNINRVLEHGGRAVRIVTDMLRMGRGGGQAQATNINQLVEQHTKLAYHGARAANNDLQLKLNYEFSPNVGEISVVSQDIGRVVLNVVSNSCYATHEKRMRAIEAAGENQMISYIPALSVKTSRDDQNVRIRIRDNGDGIPDELREKVFNPFFTTKPTDQGTGLGLAMCSDIINKHGGSIDVDSQKGEYTEMTITIPVSAGKILAEAEAQESDE